MTDSAAICPSVLLPLSTPVWTAPSSATEGLPKPGGRIFMLLAIPQPGERQYSGVMELSRVSDLTATRQGSASVLPSDKPCSVLPNRNADAKSVIGKQFLNILRPLHYAECSHIEVVVQAYVKGFGKLVDTVEVEMEHRLSAAGPVFVDYGEGRRTDCILPYAEYAAYGSCESGFAAAHWSIEGNEVPAGGLLEKVPGGCIDGCEGGYDNFVFHSDDKFT